MYICVCVCSVQLPASPPPILFFSLWASKCCSFYHARNTVNTVNSHSKGKKCGGKFKWQGRRIYIRPCSIGPCWKAKQGYMCRGNYTHGNYNVLHRYLEPCTKLGGPLEAAFVFMWTVYFGGFWGADMTRHKYLVIKEKKKEKKGYW